MLNDGSGGEPRLRFDLALGTLAELPPWSTAPRGSWADIYATIRAAGYEGLQHSAPIRKAFASGLRMSGAGRVLDPGEFDALAARHKAAGMDLTTLHVGTGMESDAELDRFAGALLDATERHGHPLYLELHRATMTQDSRRTLDLVARFPALRFNADLSHWYTGHEMTYGDLEGKLDLLGPVFARVRFLHGRVGDSCSMQRAVGRPDGEPDYVRHFRDMWIRCFRAFLLEADPGDVVVFAPELLPAFLSTADSTLR